MSDEQWEELFAEQDAFWSTPESQAIVAAEEAETRELAEPVRHLTGPSNHGDDMQRSRRVCQSDDPEKTDEMPILESAVEAKENP